MLKTILIILGSPIWIAIFAVAIALYASVWAVIISFWAVTLALALSAVGCVILGVIYVFTSGLTGFAVIGAALVCAGLSVFAALACKALTLFTVNLTKSPFK